MNNVDNRVVGTWKLVAASSSTVGGERNDAPFGPSPTGFLTYTAEGRMMAIVSYGGRQNLSVRDPAVLPVEEQAEAFRTLVAYAGRYAFSGDKIIHHVEVSSIQNWAKTDLVRAIRFEGERMVLTAPPTPLRGQMQTFELIWQRLPANS
jgi:hypothetical protein